MGQNRSTNQRSGIILEVQIQNFSERERCTRRCTSVKVFIFKKFQGAEISIFFCENWHETSFYNKEQTQKYKFERRWTIIALRNLIFYFWSNIELTWHEYSFMPQITNYKEKIMEKNFGTYFRTIQNWVNFVNFVIL